MVVTKVMNQGLFSSNKPKNDSFSFFIFILKSRYLSHVIFFPEPNQVLFLCKYDQIATETTKQPKTTEDEGWTSETCFHCITDLKT